MNKLKNKIAYILLFSIICFALPSQSKAESAGSRNNIFGGASVNGYPILLGEGFTDIQTYLVDTLVFTGTKTNTTIDMMFGRTLLRAFGGTVSSGIVSIDFGGDESSQALDVDGNFRIVIAGGTSLNGGDIAVARVTGSVGDLDNSFDGDGKVTTDIPGRDADAFGVAVQPDNKIVIAGRLLGGPNTDAVFVRYNENGSLDTTFGTGGIVTLDVAGTTNLALDVEIASDGKIVASGLSGSNFAVYRLNSNGTMDTTFDGDGVSLVQVGTGNGRANAFGFTSDGKIVAVGSTGGNQGLGVVKLNTNGTLDTTFATGGIFTWDLFPGGETLTDVNVSSFSSEFEIIASMHNFDQTGGAIALRSNGTINYKFGACGYYKNSDLGGYWDGIVRRDKMLFFTTQKPSVSNAILSLNLDPTPSHSNDFDGDGFSDYVIFRPSTANWFVLRSSDSTVQISSFGANGDVPLDGDFDGDGKSDMAIYRPSLGQWWFNRSSDGTAFATQFGTSSDKPVVGDYDKDGKTDIAFWRPSNGNYYALRSSENFASFYSFPFGANGDVPVGTAVYP